MDRRLPISTNRLLALKALEESCGQECVDWAIRQLEAGVTTRHVMMLAGMAPPFDSFEIASLRDRALEELGLTTTSRSEALTLYAAEIAADALHARIDLYVALKELSRLCIEQDYVSELYDFYLLYFAWADLLRSGVQWHWPDATLATIVEIARAGLELFVNAAASSGLVERA
jgi:hypothetical protein